MVELAPAMDGHSPASAHPGGQETHVLKILTRKGIILIQSG